MFDWLALQEELASDLQVLLKTENYKVHILLMLSGFKIPTLFCKTMCIVLENFKFYLSIKLQKELLTLKKKKSVTKHLKS